MATEITVKIEESKEKLINKLNKNDFLETEKFDLIDEYYSVLSVEQIQNASYSELMKKSVLLRTVEQDCIQKSFVVYKNKELDAFENVIDETKISAKIENIDQMGLILKALGFNCWCKTTNHSTVFSNGGKNIILQEVEDLGLFVEYEENESHKELSPNEKIESLLNELNLLEIKFGNDYSCKKPFMMLHK